MIDVRLAGADGTAAKVTPSGEVVVAPLHYSTASFNSMSATGTAYGFWQPLPLKQFVITGMIIRAAFSVSNTADATVVIYEATDESSTTANKIIHQEALTRSTSTIATQLNLLVSAGQWVNGKTDDATVTATVFGYYIDELQG